MKLWHNPRCSKSRAALKLLQDAGHAPETFLYLQTPPDRASLNAILDKLQLPAGNLIRRSQAEWKNSGLDLDAAERDLRNLMVQHPILIERPILELGDTAVIGRPPEKVLDLLG